MYTLTFEVLNLYPVNSSSHIWQTSLDRIITLLIFAPKFSVFPSILFKDFVSEWDWFYTSNRPYLLIAHTNFSSSYPIYLSVIFYNTFIVRDSSNPISNL